MVSTLCFVAALTAQSPAADSLRLLAMRVPEAALVVETRARASAVREAISGALARNDLEAARRIAAAYAAALQDSFLVRDVARIAAWPPPRRAARVWTDSVRRAGVRAFSRDGPMAAIVVWRPALARAREIADTALTAGVLGNIGAAWVEEGQLDSADAYLARARALARTVGDVRVEANALGSLAGVSEQRGDLAAARDRYTEALALRQRIGDTRGQAADYNNLGILAQTLGDNDEARRQFEAALALNRREGRDEVAATNLVNLAGVASLAGDFGRAEAWYRDALATWRARGQWADAAAALRGLGQLELRRGDYPAARVVLREAQAIYARTGPLSDALAVRRELAAALAAQGEIQGALNELRRIQQRADSARAPPSVRAGIALARADLSVQMNALDQAEQLYGRADFLYRQAGDPAGSAEAQEGRGALALERQDYPRAQNLLDAALRTLRAVGNPRAAGVVRISLGRLAAARGDTAAARQSLALAARELDSIGDPVATAAAFGELAALEAHAGGPAIAESLYRVALARLGDRAAPDVAWRLHAGLGVVRRGAGALDDAVRELRTAATQLERPSRSLTLAERRAAFLADKWDIYSQLALTEHARGRAGAAFEASERLRAREMLELLARGRVGTAASSDGVSDLVAREQDLRRRIAEVTDETQETGRGAEAAPASLARLQDSYGELLLEMRERAPTHAALVAGTTASWRDVAHRLAADEALIEYLVSDSTALAFVVTADTMTALDLGIGRRDLARLVDFARGTIERRGSPATDSLWRGPMRQLNARLIAPIEELGLLAAKTRLVLVPHAELHYLPFAALLEGRGSRFLVERYDLTFTPSATVWLALGDRPAGQGTSGLLALAPRPQALPASRREVAAIGRLPGATVLTGAAATEMAFRREAPTRRVLHLATSGVLNKRNPMFSFVELASGGGDTDGRLEVHEVFGLQLAADLVVLSACQTGLGSGAGADVPAGDDWVGLTRAFLHAGARHVVATLWAVDDWATAALMEQFYAASEGAADDPVQALALAQRALIAAAPTAHPFYWAGFVPVGGSRAQGRAP